MVDDRSLRETGDRTQLLLDPLLVAEREDVTVRIDPLRPSGDVLISPDSPWEAPAYIGHCSCVRREAGVTRIWYDLIEGRKAGDQRVGPGARSMAYAESEDGIRWVKPSLGTHAFRGNRNTNIVLTDGHMFSASVIVDPRDPDPSRRYKIAYWRRGLKVAFSPDGIHWTAPLQEPVAPGSYGDPGQPTYADEVSEQDRARAGISRAVR